MTIFCTNHCFYSPRHTAWQWLRMSRIHTDSCRAKRFKVNSSRILYGCICQIWPLACAQIGILVCLSSDVFLSAQLLAEQAIVVTEDHVGSRDAQNSVNLWRLNCSFEATRHGLLLKLAVADYCVDALFEPVAPREDCDPISTRKHVRVCAPCSERIWFC